MLAEGAALDRQLVGAELRMRRQLFGLGLLFPVLRSTTTSRPSASRSSRSTRPLMRGVADLDLEVDLGTPTQLKRAGSR